jgi:hypothetical protein
MTSPRLKNHLFFGAYAPFSSLIGAGLLVIASSRTAFALVTLGALLWVFGGTVIAFYFARPILPKRGKKLILVCLSSVFGSFYLLILFLVSPLLALETSLIIILVPVYLIALKLVNRVETLEPEDAIVRSCSEALVMGALIFALAMLREPLGFGSLSLPGGPWGIIEILNNESSFFAPVQVLGSSAGALFLLGYVVALVRRAGNLDPPGEDKP